MLPTSCIIFLSTEGDESGFLVIVNDLTDLNRQSIQGVFTFFFFLVCLCASVWVCAHESKCLCRPEESDENSLELKSQVVVSPTHSMKVQRTRLYILCESSECSLHLNDLSFPQHGSSHC